MRPGQRQGARRRVAEVPVLAPATEPAIYSGTDYGATAGKSGARGTGHDQIAAADSGRRSLTVPGLPSQAAAARQFVAGALGAGSPHAETAVLLVSELVTNSMVHSASGASGGMITITVASGAGESVRVEVADDGAGTVPVVTPVRDEDEHGRGMHLVSALAASWGSHRRGNSLVTWFELASGPRRADPGPADEARGQ